MAAIMNGVALHGGLVPYGGTFAVFSDYARNGMRMSALMKQRVIYVLTHDSIGLGEDGPTHQPIEHMASLRYIPNNDVWRPCDAVESAVSWAEAIKRRTGPSCLIFSRQNLAHQLRSLQQVADIARGAYVLFESKPGFCDVILVATGSEVELAVQAAKQLAEKGVAVRVVSMPSTTVFDRQDAAYRESVLPSACKRRVAVEAGTRDFWYKYVGLEGAVIGMNSFGASAPADQLYVHFGITVDAVVSAVEHLK
jgi:transketolase